MYVPDPLHHCLPLARRVLHVALLALAAALLAACPDNASSQADLPEDPGGAFDIVSVAPADGARDVPIDSAITVTFTRPVDPGTLGSGTLYLEPDVPAEYRWDEATRTASLLPLQPLRERTNYTLSITTALKTRDAQGLDRAFVSRFRTTTTDMSGQGQSQWVFGEDRVGLEVQESDEGLRQYRLSSTAPLRDNEPQGGEVRFPESPGQMTLRSGNHLLDALFALALDEARQNSVTSISDGAFNQGQGVPCDCFETGAKWNYVWTRDTAYAAHLGLALIDPLRSMRSLDFKLSRPKDGGPLEIVQDTGTGGSWPASTDRATWAIGAREVMEFLPDAERTTFAERTLEALRSTIARDRRAAYDPQSGLYRGEQSFLDWREQSYPARMARDLAPIADSRTLGTNVAHVSLLRLAAELAQEAGSSEEAARYDQWAQDLSATIDRAFWLEDAPGYSAMIASALDPAPAHKFDLLGLSLAILEDVAPQARARQALASYPHSRLAAPVLWPQQPLVPIYHNRGMWPFVSAYAVLAAHRSGHDGVLDLNLESLVRAAATNLSHMENLEFTTMRPWVDDGPYSGPVVNSRRQLWSVAGYLGAFVKGLVGLDIRQGAIAVRPGLTRAFAERWLKGQTEVTLRGLDWRGKKITVRLELPNATDPGDDSQGFLTIAQQTLNGAPVSAEPVTWDALAADNLWVLTLGLPQGPSQPARVVTDTQDFRNVWAPREPVLSDLSAVDEPGGAITLSWDAMGEEGVHFNVYRNGARAARELTTSAWTDSEPGDGTIRCYAVESVYTSSGNHSHHSNPRCTFGRYPQSVQEFTARDFAAVGGSFTENHGRAHYEDWGRPGDTLTIQNVRVAQGGPHLVQATYANGAGPLSTGITAGVKAVELWRPGQQAPEQTTVLAMPHTEGWGDWRDSTLAWLELEAGVDYRIVVRDEANMSYFEHFVAYTAGLGGAREPFNRVNIAALRLLAWQVAGQEPPATGLGLNGQDDLGKIPETRRLATGAPLADWSGIGLDWDADYIYLVQVSPAFQDPFTPWMIYLAPADTSSPAQGARDGLEYRGLTPALAFPATLAIGLRAQSQAPDESPWNGLWQFANGQWQRQATLVEGRDFWVSQDRHTISMRLARTALGSTQSLWLAAHAVHGQPANEWKELLPPTHTPWDQGGQYLEIDLSRSDAAAAWPMRP